MSTTGQRSSRTKTPTWLLVGPPVIVMFIALGVTLLRREPGRMPALDRTPREAVVVAHRNQSMSDTRSQHMTTVEYRASDERLHRADLLEELTPESIRALPPGSPVEIYAFQDPRYARTAVFLTEKHDELIRKSIGSIMWGVNRSALFADGPVAGSPYVGPDDGEVFAVPESEPASAAPEPPRRQRQVSARTARVLVVIAWILAGLAFAFAVTAGFDTFSADDDARLDMMLIAFGVALGAMFLDGGTATRRGTLARWAVLRLIGILTLGIYIGVLLLLIPAVWGLVRRFTGGATPRIEQQRIRNLTGLVLSTMLIALALAGAGRLTWWSEVTSTHASSGIGIGGASASGTDDGSTREIVVVPYKLDGLPTYHARVAAISLEDGELLWDRKLDSDVWGGFPVAVTSFDRPVEDGTDDKVVITTERGDFGFDLSRGDEDCGPDSSRSECGIEAGQGTLADTGEPAGEGFDLYDSSPNGVDLTEIDGMTGFTNERFDTVLDPATGEPAGDGFRVEYADGVRIVVGDRTIDQLTDVSSLQQVLVAPSGKVVLLMDDENNKSIIVIASKDGFQQVTVGDRGLVAWPAWMG